jgi:hypothetical protein
MPAVASKTSPRAAFGLATQPDSGGDTAARLFAALAPLHRLGDRDEALLVRAGAGYRFIRAMHPFGEDERSLMRIALADLGAEESLVVEAAANCVADLVFDDEPGAWGRLSDDDRRRVLWLSAILRLAESIDAVCRRNPGTIHVIWTEEILHVEVDGDAWSEHDVGRVLGRKAALEAVSGRRVIFTSSGRRRGAA